MEKMAERVPGVTDTEFRTLSIDDATGVGGHHIEITFAYPRSFGHVDVYRIGVRR